MIQRKNKGHKLYESKKINLEVVVRLEEGENKDSAYEQIKKDLMTKGDAWEQELRASCTPKKESNAKKNGVPVITDVQNKSQDQVTIIETNGLLVCPQCGEDMFQKEGKDYYVDSKHWGYPDMIRKGQVKDKRF